jgi:hypothetical protein
MDFIKRNSKIFILSGKARSGKTETAKIIENYYKEKKCITISFAYYLKDYIKRITGWDGNENTKPRELLQNLGIELIKNNIDDKLLINRILQDIEVFSYFYDIIIISDARLMDEIESIKNMYPDSVSIRISNKHNNNLTKEQKNHITETGLDNYNNFDYFVNNDYDNLEKEIENILRSVKYE